MFMNHLVIVLLAGSLALTGCVVSKDKYEAAINDLQSTEAELDKARQVNRALDQQVKNLKELNRKLVAEQEAIDSKVQRLEEGRDQQREKVEARVKELEGKIRELIIQSRKLHRQGEALQKENRALKVTVRRYQKELKEAREHLRAQAKRRDDEKETRPEADMESSRAAAKQKDRERASKPKAVASPPKSALAPVNINSASVNDMVLFLGLSKKTAQQIVDHRPYRLRGELVAKNIVPKPTFDVIKDRITAAPAAQKK